jgi:hypothetical protein
MQVKSVVEKSSVSPSIIEFLESRARLTGLVREIYIARGWIRPTGFADEHYQITPKGAHILQPADMDRKNGAY